MIWRDLFNLFTGREAPDAPPPWAAYQPVSDLPDEQVRTALVQTGLCHGRYEDLAFVRAAIGGNKFAKSIDLRRYGSPLAEAALKSLGLRTTAIVTAEYLAILTPEGRADPIGAAQALTAAYQEQLAGTNSLGRAAHAGIELVEVIPNNMAAGPCPACLTLAKEPIPIADAPTGPLPECPHPTQCKLWTRAVLPFV